jgi:hypothetical protein
MIVDVPFFREIHVSQSGGERSISKPAHTHYMNGAYASHHAISSSSTRLRSSTSSASR